ncbi:hypothetical protein KCU57_14915 [Xanthomonas translucens]|uniref:hypothetical protein n=1 Tax=Xanthomonas campestris pv. translucens TaxID=343 RepID=UPI001F3B5A67|nr:hypothetical protein [Xanthomonas translucens]UKE49997.1 hypothetical protein KCU57_14915 [Xanthomonas translucens]
MASAFTSTATGRNLLGKGSHDDRVQACAWRGIIVAAGHKEADASDVGNVAAACDRLSDAELQRARTWAAMLIQQSTQSAARARASPAPAGFLLGVAQ